MDDDPKVEILRNFFRLGAFIGLCGLLLVFVEPRDSPEFVLSVCSALMGGALMLAVAIMLRRSR